MCPQIVRTRRQALLQLSAIALGGVLSPAKAAAGVDADRIGFGMSAPFSGPVGAYGQQLRQGIESCFQSVNAQGGIGGRRLDLVSLDDGYEPEAAVANTRRLIEQDRVFGLLGYYGTASSTAVMPVIEQADVPLVGTISGAPALRTPDQRHVFHLRASYGDETATIVKNLVTVGITRVAVLYQDDGFGKAGLDGVAAALRQRSLEVVAVAPVPRNSLEVQPAVSAIAKAQPQAVVLVALYKPAAEFINRLQAAGQRPHFVALSPIGTDRLIELLGRENSRGIEISQVIPNPWSDRLAVTREYKRLQAEQGRAAAVSYYGLEGYLNAKLVVAALRRVEGNPTRDKFMAALRGAPFDLGGYRVQFSDNRNAGSSYVEISVIGADGRILT